MLINRVLQALDLPELFTITDPLIHRYMEKYNEISGKKGKLKSSEFKFCYRMAALNLLKYKREHKIPITEGFVYVIGNPAWPGLYKIGMTVDVNERLSSYQTYSPYRDYKLYHFRFSSDKRRTEKALHNLLKDYKVSGEWFEVPLLDAFKLLVENLDC
ncbi:hypothetical protein KSS14E_0060 [Escherichia coli phage KS_S14]|nr:hypothetical protein KSS14E_0060 [Escherichia coli phage KS_S14]